MSDHSKSSYPTAAGRGWIPASRDIGLPGESFPRTRRLVEGDPSFRWDDGEGWSGREAWSDGGGGADGRCPSGCEGWAEGEGGADGEGLGGGGRLGGGVSVGDAASDYGTEARGEGFASGQGASGLSGAHGRFGEREGDGPGILPSSSSSSSSGAVDLPFGDGASPLHHPADGPPPRAGEDFHNGWSAQRKVRFLHHLAEKGDVRSAAARVGMSRQSAYMLRRRDRVFAQGWAAALVLARAHVEEVLATRALDGVEEAVFYHGEQVAVRRRFDARLLLAHLARLDRAAEETVAGAHAARFDEVLALLAGEAPGEMVLAGAPGEGPGDAVLPPERADYVSALGDALAEAEREAWLDAVDAGEDVGDAPDLGQAECRAVAAAEWDGWQARAFAAVDAVLGEGVERCPEAGGPVEFKSMDGPCAAGDALGVAGLCGPVEVGVERAWPISAGPCQLCQPERAGRAQKNATAGEPDACGDVLLGEGRRGASPTPLRYRVGLTPQDQAAGRGSGDQLSSSSSRTAISTLPEPAREMPILSAAALLRSIRRFEWNGPRSLTVTITDWPLAGLVTRTCEPSGSVRCAAVSCVGSKRSPLAVRLPASSRP